jgi:hypothetical protein
MQLLLPEACNQSNPVMAVLFRSHNECVWDRLHVLECPWGPLVSDCQVGRVLTPGGCVRNCRRDPTGALAGWLTGLPGKGKPARDVEAYVHALLC